MVEPIDREAFEERAKVSEFDGGLSQADAESLAWREDDRRRCTQCLNRRPHDGVCRIAEPKTGALLVASRSYRYGARLQYGCHVNDHSRN